MPSGKALVTPILPVAIALVAMLALTWEEQALAPIGPPDNPRASRTAAFSGSSAARVFLTRAESIAAAEGGLVPTGTRSIISTGGKLSHGQWRWDDEGVPPGSIGVRVDLDRQLVSVFQGPDEIGTAVIVYGIDGKETPRGKLPIRGKSRDYHSITYDAPMPFSLWLREDGVALHGSSVSMGKATNGCIGVPVAFAEKLFAVAEKGDIIEVVG